MISWIVEDDLHFLVNLFRIPRQVQWHALIYNQNQIKSVKNKVREIIVQTMYHLWEWCHVLKVIMIYSVYFWKGRYNQSRSNVLLIKWLDGCAFSDQIPWRENPPHNIYLFSSLRIRQVWVCQISKPFQENPRSTPNTFLL